MTNAEKYLKDNVSVEEFINEFHNFCAKQNNNNASSIRLEQFLSRKVQPTLTEDERVKEMVYTNERKREVLATGYYFGLLYYVLSLGTHPTAYVKIPKDNWLCTVKNYDDIPIECHGGITFRADHLLIADNQEIEGEFIGWDYAHCTDYAPYYDEVLSKDTHKWTTKEILEEVKEVCSQIVEFGKKLHLTEDERVILRNIKNEEYNGIIGREDNETYQVGKLYLRNKYSGAKAFAFSTLYNHLFQFIKERRRIRDKRIIRR